MDPTYKVRKEAFVSNLSGGSIWEINAVTLVAPVSVLLWSALQARRSFFSPYTPTALVTDFLLNVSAILFATTLYSSAPLLLILFLLSPAALVFLTPKPTRPKAKRPPRFAAQQSQDAQSGGADSAPRPLPTLPFLTTYRGAMMVVTCLSILAVDFPVFPRRFAKAENWGTSLMDLGVGSFVFSAGVVSARSVLREREEKRPLAQRLPVSARHSIPLLVLGLIRLYSVKGLDYAEHVTEYGVHWNFFFTLGFLPPFVELFSSLTAFVPSFEILSLAIVVLYQVVLESTDLKAYILVSPRGPDLLSKNREGVFSFLGYLAIFLAGRAAGVRVMGSGAAPRQARRRTLISLGLGSLFWSILFVLNSTYALGYGAKIPVSRRLANMPYVLWIAAFNNAQIFLFCLIDTLLFPLAHKPADRGSTLPPATSQIMAAFNQNGLLIFLAANLLTGAVNLTVSTLDASTAQAMLILTVYAATITGVAMGLNKFGIKLKL
ncbi:hypothetical protein ASPZODRAFT_133446 [Penicilliopsis zonata CBS 506.65]|uniref:GPI-anchored wall transfer protein n=1 Tax=Penicilliopsis zonata CBS 506.65 TaxID=1073090 RepID=A0A1L9SEK8_9EURO|nr:hypothetical protein ASPZODRAFT_133446 [Penicilliopsis zonata CBS 506.65]OJJ45599.1 hypothetical protein ASPZODRAFT_133446 [Penicilliopsis zonata CBS 506.65]